MKKLLFTMLFGAALVLGACGSDKENGSGKVAVDPEKVVQQKCIQCHGDQLNNGNAPDISKAGETFSKDDIKKIIKDGQGAMPGGLISGEEAEKVAKYLADKK